MNFLIALLAAILGTIPVFFFRNMGKNSKWAFFIIWTIIFACLGYMFIVMILSFGYQLLGTFIGIVIVWWIITFLIIHSANR